MIVAPYIFNGKESGSLELDSRVFRCVNSDGSIAWTNAYHTRREATDRFLGDLRAMRKNDCYVFGVDLNAIFESLEAAA